MATDYRRIVDYLRDALAGRSPNELLAPRDEPVAPRVPTGAAVSEAEVAKRWRLPGLPESSRIELADERTLTQGASYQHHIENFIGTVKLPVGLAGPLRVNGLHARDDYYVPLATCEATLVGS